MKRTGHLLVILAEECAEVAQRCTKALRFGLDEKEPGQDLTNAERIAQELIDLFAVADMLERAGALPMDDKGIVRGTINKRNKVEKYLDYSQKCGTLDTEEV